MSKISGVILADKIAEGKKLTKEEQAFLASQKEESQKAVSIWKKNKQANMEYDRGFKIELEKERRVKAGLPEYDIQPNTGKPSMIGKKKVVSGTEIAERAKGSEQLGEMRKKSRAKALAAKAKHQAEAGTAKPETIHKTLKKATQLDPESTKGINERELLSKGTEAVKQETVKPAVNSETVKGTENAVKDAAKKSKKFGGFFSKIGKFFKGKGGKIAIGAGIAALLTAGAVWIYNKVTGKKSETPAESTPVKETKPAPVKNEDDKTKPATPVPDDKDKKDDKVGKDDKTKPVKPDEPDKTDKSDKPKDSDKKGKELPKDYVVKKGDCVWNIAKQHLKDLHADEPDYKPTDKEILKHTKELMELNKLEYEEDGYHVLIKPDDKLKLVA